MTVLESPRKRADEIVAELKAGELTTIDGFPSRGI
jgi:hypothetical protein